MSRKKRAPKQIDNPGRSRVPRSFFPDDLLDLHLFPRYGSSPIPSWLDLLVVLSLSAPCGPRRRERAKGFSSFFLLGSSWSCRRPHTVPRPRRQSRSAKIQHTAPTSTCVYSILIRKLLYLCLIFFFFVSAFRASPREARPSSRQNSHLCLDTFSFVNNNAPGRRGWNWMSR